MRLLAKRIQKHANIVAIGTNTKQITSQNIKKKIKFLLRNGPTDDDPYGLSPHYWHVFAARLAFVVVFEVSTIVTMTAFNITSFTARCIRLNGHYAIHYSRYSRGIENTNST